MFCGILIFDICFDDIIKHGTKNTMSVVVEMYTILN